MNVQDLADALSGAYDRGYAQGKADALDAQPAPVPEDDIRYLLSWCNGLDGVDTVSAWLDSLRTDAEQDGAAGEAA